MEYPLRRLQYLLQLSQPIRIAQFVLAIAVFCYAALSPSPQILTQHSDSSMHFIGNILLYLSAWLALWGRISIVKLAFCLLPFSGMIEMAQYFSPGRVVDIKDLLVNAAGLFCGAIIAFLTHTALVWFFTPNQSS